MKNIFLTEMNFTAKIPPDHTNLRTEFVWMLTANADHLNIWKYDTVHGYDNVFVIIPKGKFTLNVEGSKISNIQNPVSSLVANTFITTLKDNNKNVYVIQEGPSWIYNDWSVIDQSNWYKNVWECDGILCHNKHDIMYFKGLFPHLNVNALPTMIKTHGIVDIVKTTDDKTIIGGNLSRWYGGFQSYIVANTYELPIWTQTSHSTREDEDLLGIHHLPRLDWTEWMHELSSFKYAVHLMPTVAAGTFSANTAWWGIPTIGNKYLDTQKTLFPDLCVHPDDVHGAIQLALRLKTDSGFYANCSEYAKDMVHVYVSDGKYDNFFNNIEF